MVGGGGAAPLGITGVSYCGAGGAGAVAVGSAELLGNTTYSIIVGRAGNNTITTAGPGLNGGDTTLVGPNLSITARGGGAGGYVLTNNSVYPPNSGGSGGGAAGPGSTPGGAATYGSATGTAKMVIYGNPGGSSSTGASSGGGGGAMSAGGNASAALGGVGGAGYTWPYTLCAYGAGGGGKGTNNPVNGTGWGNSFNGTYYPAHNPGCGDGAFEQNNQSNIYYPCSGCLIIVVLPYPCFKKGTKILTERGYVPIQKLQSDDLIKTFRHGFVPIWKIGKRQLHHPATQERIPNQLYVCDPDQYPGMTEPLVMTGYHSILIQEWSDEQEKQRAGEVNGNNVYITDGLYRLPVCADRKSRVFPDEGLHTIYHLALENDDYYGNYGIYANGLLVESCSKRFLTELSGMDIVTSRNK